nr:DUF885 domain-containing protein [Polymorphobacter sp.]
MKLHFARIILAGLLLGAAPLLAAPADDLKSVIGDHWAWSLSVDPFLATQVGDKSGDGKLPDPSLAEADRQAATAQTFIDRLDRIDDKALSPEDAINRDVLRRMLKDRVDGNRFGQRAMTFTTYSGWHTGFAGYPESAKLETKADYDAYLGRLAAYPAYNKAQIAVTRTGLAGGYAQPCEPLKGFDKSISTHVVARPEDSVFWAPFAAKRPAIITETDWTALQTRARALITTGVVPAYAELLAFYTAEYAPKCRQTVGIGATPGGTDYYAYRAREMTTTDLTPEAIHEIGLSEVARINAAMDRVAADAGFPDRKAYVAHLRSDPKYYAKTPQELLEKTAWVTKQIDDWMPKIIGKLPRLPFSVKPIPADQAEGTTTAYSEWGSVANGRAGVYRVNTTHLDQRPLYELPALSLHEAAPGHQTQGSLQQELAVPDFRRHLASFTAFVEGWALYAESLGDEMGLYDTPEKKMGRYSYEMWRATRLVVDTGMHVKGWSRDKAIQYMMANTALSQHNVEAEINRYITWPGQALAYKIGELRIKQLRAKAETALGNRFDERRFHDTLLENGPVPLDVLEAHVDRWIARQKA